MKASDVYANLLKKFNARYKQYGEKANSLYQNYSEEFDSYNRLRDLNRQMCGGCSQPNTVMSRHESKQLKRYWEAAEDYVKYAVLEFPMEYMVPKSHPWCPLTPPEYVTCFLSRIHVNLDRFIYVEKRRPQDTHFVASLNTSLFCYAPLVREQVSARIRDLFFVFLPKFSVRPYSFKRKFLPFYDYRTTSTVEGSLVHCREKYLDSIEQRLRAKLASDVIPIIFQYLHGSQSFFSKIITC